MARKPSRIMTLPRQRWTHLAENGRVYFLYHVDGVYRGFVVARPEGGWAAWAGDTWKRPHVLIHGHASKLAQAKQRLGYHIMGDVE